MQLASAVHVLRRALGPNHSATLSEKRASRTEVTGESAPQGVCRGGIARRAAVAAAVAALLCCEAGPAAAQPSPPGAGASPPPRHFAALGVLGGAVRLEGAWDSVIGAELAVGGLCDECPLAAWAAGASFVGFGERGGGRASLEGALGTRWPTGLLLGASAGPVLQVDPLRRPRAGGQASVWLFAGVVPYVRVGAVERSGLFVDLGLRIPLPAGRW